MINNTAKLISIIFISLFITNVCAAPMLCPNMSNSTPPLDWYVLNIATGKPLSPQPATIQLDTFIGAAYSEHYAFKGECFYRSANKVILLGSNTISKPVADLTNAWKWSNNLALCKTTDLTACIFGSS